MSLCLSFWILHRSMHLLFLLLVAQGLASLAFIRAILRICVRCASDIVIMLVIILGS